MIEEHLVVLDRAIKRLEYSLSSATKNIVYDGVSITYQIGTLEHDYKHFRDEQDSLGRTVTKVDYYHFVKEEINRIKAHIRQLQATKGYSFPNHISKLNDLLEYVNSIISEKSESDSTKIGSRKNICTLDWLGNTAQISLLHQLLIDYKIISNQSSFTQVENIFSSNISSTQEPIKWLKSNKLLVYLFEMLLNYDLIQCKIYQAHIENFNLFINSKGKPLTKNDLSTAKTNLTKNLVGCELIDYIIDEIRKS